MKLILDWLLIQRNGLKIYNKIEWVLVITKWRFNYYNTDFSLEMTSKVQEVSQKYTFTHKLTTKRNFQTPSLFFAQLSWNGTQGIVGYQKQQRIRLCCLQNPNRRRYLRRQEVKQNLDSDVPWCLPALEYSLRKQHFRAFGSSQYFIILLFLLYFLSNKCRSIRVLFQIQKNIQTLNIWTVVYN